MADRLTDEELRQVVAVHADGERDFWPEDRLIRLMAAELLQLRQRVAELEARQRRHEIALGQAWDDGNAAGLDGWVGPGRGGGEVDDEAERARTRAIEAGLGAPAGDPEKDWQDWADVLTDASPAVAFRAGWHAAYGAFTPKEP